MDLIDRAEVLYKFAEILPEADSLEWYEQAKPEEVKDLVDEMYSIVLNVNRADAKYVKHGRWIENSDPGQNINEHYMCSECGCTFHNWANDNYCPSCGTKMDGENDA